MQANGSVFISDVPVVGKQRIKRPVVFVSLVSSCI